MLRSLQQLRLWLQHADPRLLPAGAIAATVLLLLLWWVVRRRRPSAEEQERLRRERLARIGRITDGSLIDARTLTNEESSSPTPEVLIYRYRLAGVIYECAQDVSHLPELSRGCELGNAVQVRYDPRNPGDSIVLAEAWSGLWLRNSPAGQPPPDPGAGPRIRRSP